MDGSATCVNMGVFAAGVRRRFMSTGTYNPGRTGSHRQMSYKLASEGFNTATMLSEVAVLAPQLDSDGILLPHCRQFQVQLYIMHLLNLIAHDFNAY